MMARLITEPLRALRPAAVTNKTKRTEVDYRTSEAQPDEDFTENHHAQPVSKRTGELDITQLHREAYDQKETAEKVKSILVENQHVLLVLF